MSLQMLLLPPGLMRPGFTRPSLLSPGEGKGGKALRTHGCSILCQRSGIRRAAGRAAGGRPAPGAGRLLGPLPAWGAGGGAGGHRSSPGGEGGLLCKGLNPGAGVWGGVEKYCGAVLLA